MILVEITNCNSHIYFRNCSLAFRIAEKNLGISPLLDVSDVVKAYRPDKLSIMTYVSQFYHKFEEGYILSAYSSGIILEKDVNFWNFCQV